MGKIMFVVDRLADLPSSLVMSRDDIIVLDIPITCIKHGAEDVVFHDMTADDFIDVNELVEQGYVSKTSLPQIYETLDETKYGITSLERVTRQALSEDKDVLYLAVNHLISGTFDAASALFEEINNSMPENNSCRALCIDTACASTGLAMLFKDLIDEYDQGKITSVSEAKEYIEQHKSSIAMVFSWFEFEYVKKSGKVKALPAFLGKVFGIHPIGSVEYTTAGRPLITFSRKVRGTKKFYGVLARFIQQTIVDPSGIITIAHGNCLEKVEELAEIIKLTLPEATICYGKEWRCGAAIQAHGGPTSIHINYHRKAPNSFEESEQILESL